MLAAQLIDNYAARGKYHFTTEEAMKILGASPVAARAALRRLREKGCLAMPFRGFHVIIPPEYRRLGCLPADQFIPQLMEYINQPYYVALLSAARYHGAAHQQPQIFHVMTPKNRPLISCKEVRIRFVARRNAAEVPTIRFNTPRGYVLVSSPEITAFDLVGYYNHAGGLDNVATVLSELAEALMPEDMVKWAELSPMSWAQRLGYLLDFVGAKEKTKALANYVNRNATEICPLMTGKNWTDFPRETRWKLAVNIALEPDL